MSKSWSWAHAMQKSDLKSTTKLVLYNLLMHMDSMGRKAYPSLETQAKETSLSVRTVQRALREALDDGWLKKSYARLRGNDYNTSEYAPCLPEGIQLGVAHEDQNEEKYTEVSQKVMDTMTGTFENEEKVLDTVSKSPGHSDHLTNQVTNQEKKNTKKPFEKFWENYPRKISKAAAKRKFESILKTKQATFEQIMAGLDGYNRQIALDKTEMQFIQHPHRWLNNGRWDDDTATKPAAPPPKPEVEIPTVESEEWDTVMGSLKDRHRQKHDTWLRCLRLVDYGNKITLVAPSSTVRDAVMRTCLDELRSAIAAVDERVPELVIQSQEEFLHQSKQGEIA